ncbi:serine hydrolase domain-containing protein [Janibacter sp. DB-40]|uniref:serine hydrolase domain-containing protein n=1 Tax=Janibacter sp. DB-40 TaxID=3028808 RepID=UPI002406EE70|nr:serine hydrolase domain-containing protein [Janibacter sp. DB-40]
MSALTVLAETCDRLVDDGSLVGWVAGVRDRDGVQISAGGRRSIDGPPMDPQTLFMIASCSKPVGGVLALRLVEQGLISLDDPVSRWLPELARPRVLTRPDADLADTAPAERPITVEHLLTMTPGFGWVTERPLSVAMNDAGVAPGPFPPPMTPEEYLGRLASLPLANQPGSTWRYHTSSDVLGVLLARATGRSVSDLLEEHVCRPLGLGDTGFSGDPGRMARVHGSDLSGALVPFPVPEGTFTTPPRFESLATGLVATVGDQLAVLASLAGTGPALLAPESVATMRRPHLVDEQRAAASDLLDPDSNWGLHVETRPDGRFGWAGGLGTIGYADPATGRAAFLATQVTVDAPGTVAAFEGFWPLLD